MPTIRAFRSADDLFFDLFDRAMRAGERLGDRRLTDAASALRPANREAFASRDYANRFQFRMQGVAPDGPSRFASDTRRGRADPDDRARSAAERLG